MKDRRLDDMTFCNQCGCGIAKSWSWKHDRFHLNLAELAAAVDKLIDDVRVQNDAIMRLHRQEEKQNEALYVLAQRAGLVA